MAQDQLDLPQQLMVSVSSVIPPSSPLLSAVAGGLVTVDPGSSRQGSCQRLCSPSSCLRACSTGESTQPTSKCSPEMQGLKAPMATPNQWGEEQMDRCPNLYPQWGVLGGALYSFQRPQWTKPWCLNDPPFHWLFLHPHSPTPLLQFPLGCPQINFLHPSRLWL